MTVKFLQNNVDSIIFDLGGVVLNLDPQKTFNNFAKITGIPTEKIFEYANYDVFKQYEKGEISSDVFRKNLGDLFKIKMEDSVLDAAWNAMLLELPKDRLEMIGKLKEKYQTFILSNTNEIHITAFDKIVANVTDGDEIQSYFNEVYYSHKVGMRKPNAEIFEMVIEKNKLDRSRTLFIDDTLEHIESAKKVGLQTWHLTNQEELFTAFDNG